VITTFWLPVSSAKMLYGSKTPRINFLPVR
jgi:hypothetical protein